MGTDVAADVHIGNVDREDFERRPGIQPLLQDGLRNGIRIFQHRLVILGRANGGHDPFAHARDDGLLTGAAHQALDVGTDRDPGDGLELDPILGHGRNHGGLDDLGVDADAHRLQDITAGQVDGGGSLKG